MKKLKFMTMVLTIVFFAGCTKDCGCIDPSKIKDAVCIQIYDPVCGCDGKEYSNECEASNAGLTSWTKGPCQYNALLENNDSKK